MAVDVDPEATALITFTTGSTGTPKGADRSHAFLMEQNRVLARHMSLQPGTADLTTLPIIVLNNLACAVTSIIPALPNAQPERLKAGKLVGLIRKYNIESSAGSPFIFESLAEYLTEKREQKIHLKKIFIGGAAVFPQLIKKLQRVIPKARIEIVYGSTEAEPISAFVPGKSVQTVDDVLHSGLLVGKPVDDISLRIIDDEQTIAAQMSADEFDAISRQQGLPGEICVSGAHVLKKYFRDETANKENKIYVQGVTWHRTGDAGYLDKDYNLYLLGRSRQRFDIEGRTYYVFPFESCLAASPHILAGTVMKVDGQVYVLIELANQSDRAQARKETEALKLPFPYTVHFTKLPRDPRHNSKIDYDRLRKHIKRNNNV
jgi:acyl-CoA synthetase (AMP-forming)/AMP-acid ligase II